MKKVLKALKLNIDVKCIKVKNGKTDFLNKTDVLYLLRYCKKNNLQELRQVILIGIYTGLRVSNILSISTSDIDNNYLRIWKNKTSIPYSVPIKQRLRVILNKNFKPFKINYQSLYYQFKTACRACNLPDTISLHTLRHTFCSWLAIKGVQIYTIQTLANHTNINTTRRYMHLNNKTLEAAINLL